MFAAWTRPSKISGLPETPPDPFRWFDSSPEVIRLMVMMYVKYLVSLWKVEDSWRSAD
jgi:hypothetical protein